MQMHFHLLLYIQYWQLVIFEQLSGDHREGEIPDPIPNSEVKTLVADGTNLKRLEE